MLLVLPPGPHFARGGLDSEYGCSPRDARHLAKRDRGTLA